MPQLVLPQRHICPTTRCKTVVAQRASTRSLCLRHDADLFISTAVVIDGWGVPSESSPKDGDAITNAKTPVMDGFAASDTGYTKLEASSLAVGLPEGLMGNSEVGHLNIGAGRVVWQDVVRIDQTVKKGEFAKTKVISEVLQRAKDGNGRLHLCGLVSHGGVVSHPPSLVQVAPLARH